MTNPSYSTDPTTYSNPTKAARLLSQIEFALNEISTLTDPTEIRDAAEMVAWYQAQLDALIIPSS